MGKIRINDEFFNELRYRNPIDNVISSYINLKRAGNMSKGLCPFHNEKTPSFTVYNNNGSFYCFGCGKGGDVITFVRLIENLDYMEAVKLLADRSGMSLPEIGYDDSAQKLRKILLEINRETANFYFKCLIEKADGGKGLSYFTQRKLSLQTIKKFGLGYAPDDWTRLVNHLKAKGFSEDNMVLADVARKSKQGRTFDRFRNKIMFPIIDLRGNVIAFGGRKFPEDEGPKYLNSGDTMLFKKSKNLYGMNLAKNTNSESVILTEGYMDTIALHQAGIDNAIGALGTSFTQDQAQLISRYFKEVIICMDTDGAGQAATRRCIEILNKTGLKIRVVQVDGGKDPDEYIKEFGVERFKMILEGAKNDIEFKLYKLKNGFDLSVDSQRLEYFEQAAVILANETSDVAISIYAAKLSEEINIDKSILLNTIQKKRKSFQKKAQKKQFNDFIRPDNSRGFDPLKVQPKFGRAVAAEESILSIIMADSSLGSMVFNRLDSEKFVTDFNKRIYEDMKSIVSEGLDFSLTLLAADYSVDEMGKIAKIQNKEALNVNPRAVLTDCIKVLIEEKEKLGLQKAENMNDDEFEAAMKLLQKNKKGKE